MGNGDEVITTAFTFVATCFSTLHTGATPVLVDIDSLTGLLDPSGIEQKITPRTKAVVFVSLHGRVENLEQIRSLCNAYNLRFVIDAAQSHLGTFNRRPQTDFCDVATLSFYPGTNLGALGEGGALLTNSQDVKDRVFLMRDWGASEKYNHAVWGGNFRLESLQAAFLRIKLRELNNWTQERQQIADIYNQGLNPNYLLKPIGQEGSHVYHIFSICVNNRAEFCEHLNQNRIGYGFHYPRALHRQPAYVDRVLRPNSLLNSEYLTSTTVSLPIFTGQTESEIDRVLEIVNDGFD